MIQSLHVSGFKLFREITVPKLGRLNLLIGENNMRSFKVSPRHWFLIGCGCWSLGPAGKFFRSQMTAGPHGTEVRLR